MNASARAPAAALFGALALVPLAAHWGPKAYILSLGALVSFGHAAFLGIGAYAVVIASSLGVDEILWQFVLAILAALVFAAITSAISLRARGVYYIMSTLAFGQMLYFLATSLSIYGGDDGTTLSGRGTLLGTAALQGDTTFYYFSLAILALAFLILQAIVASRFGRVLGAIKQNPTRVEALGLRPFGFKFVATLIAGAFAAIAGVLLAHQSEFVSPAYMTWQRSGDLLIMVILGGVGSLWGAILGAIAYLMLAEILSGFTEQWKLILGPLLVLIALTGRGGIAGLLPRGARP